MSKKKSINPDWRADNLNEVVEILVEHDKAYPSHGYNCSCMDPLIRAARALTTAPMNDPKIQRRIDYLLRIAISNRRA